MDIYDKQIPSPCFVLEEEKLEANLKRLDYVQKQAEVDIILALKGFAMWASFDLVKRYLKGATASGLWEAKLARETIDKEVHVYSPAFKQKDIDEILPLANHISFNSLQQWSRFSQSTIAAGVSPGLRINPEIQEAETLLYDPCAPGSRLGIKASDIQGKDLSGIEGFHCHNLCECDSFAAERTLSAIEEKFGSYLSQMKWLNLGGGHLITAKNYDVEHLISVLRNFKLKYPNLRIILEPGSAVAWQTGPLISEVVDIVENDGKIAILDISATAHMPDVLEMPYRPEVRHASKAGEKAFDYKFGGNSCLAGDVLEAYSFDNALQIGDRVVFEDMMHYTMVKTTFFNGVEHPNIGVLRKTGEFELVRQFNYEDFKNKLS